MGRRNSKRLPPKSGWAVYLKTSSEEAQNPENSQRRQRHAIERSLFERTDLPVYNEYIDNLSGRYADNRPGYQQMLEDARAGHFSHVAVENAERFGRNDTEALVAIDALHELGIAVRFADYPDLDPIDPDDRILVSLSFTLARRESIKLGQRVTGGLHAKLRSGGFVGMPPDGYMNCEEKTDVLVKTQNGKYSRWVEQDPDRIHIWRLAWDLLLEDRMTLEDICEELHTRGYTYRSGRPFVEVKSNGRRKVNKNTLSHIFHNWFYAGWVVSDKAGIPPKTVRGQWQPLLTTEEFERGLEILARRNRHRVVKRKHDYLLKGLIHVDLPGGTKPVKLTGSTSNASRSGGGTAYYCVPSSNVNILCSTIDDQIPVALMGIQVDPDLIPLIRESYTDELARKLGHLRPSEREELEAALRAVDEEEARTARLYAAGKITERVWDNLWAEWQDRRRTLQINLEALQQKQTFHIRNLDAALTIIAKVGILYSKLERGDQKDLLRQMVERVVVNPEGTIIRLELLPPFSYLRHVTKRVQDNGGAAVQGKTKTSTKAGQCSDYVLSGDPTRIRT
ncbi:MAG: recombinase family protein [Anaerolineae bacterium]|nr:recombinase family protein [Anaerolineae bacterium]